MPTIKVSLSLDEGLLPEARKLAGHRGLSSYVNRALGRQLEHDRLDGLLDDLEEEAGPFDPELLEQIRHAWPAPNEGPTHEN
jgi:hypothetical protein